MSISGISSTTDLSQTNSLQAKSRQVRNTFQQLAQALQSGDLSGAQQAFAAMQQFMPNLSAGSQAQNGQQGSSQNLLLADLNAIGKALQSGDMTTANAGFAKLQQDVQSVQKVQHHRHHHKTGIPQNPVSSLNGSSSQTDGSAVSQSVGRHINIVT